MIYIYDILLNFIDGSRVYEFFEWEKNDMVEHIKRIPLYYVDDNILDDVLNKEVTFSIDFLKEIYNRTIIFGNNFDNIINYSFLFSNGERCYAFELDDKGKVIYKSSLLLDEEEEILEICSSMEKYTPSYQAEDKVLNTNILTRSEERKKNFVERDLIYTYKNKEYSKLEYLYSECFGNDKTSYKEKFDRLILSINEQNSPYRKRLNFILNLAHNKNKICK